MFDPQEKPSWHSSGVSQSPWLVMHGFSVVQKFSSPTTDCELSKQQSVSGSKPSECGQLSDPHMRFSKHSSWESQSPSSSPQGVRVVQKSSSPTVGL